jgi:8-oxo-dGTP pyrophosphatase MutT (NUDIX family)
VTSLREGDYAPARPSATICLLRDSPSFEVLMVRRSPTSKFMPRAWVYPGGVTDPIDSGVLARRLLPGAPADLQPAMAAAVRELVEEVGIWLTEDPVVAPAGAVRPEGSDVYAAASVAGATFATARLVHFANWITPTMLPKRFDTHFFAAPVPRGAVAAPDEAEIDRVEWVTPSVAIQRAASDEWQVSPPTIRTLEDLGRHNGFDEFAAAVARAGPVVAKRPRLRVDAGVIEAVAPGDPGFDDLEDLPPDPKMLENLAVVRRPGGSP